jgi:hypothetical protein
MNLVSLILIIVAVVAVVVIILLVARGGRRGGVKPTNGGSVNLSNINIQQGAGSGGMAANPQVNKSTIDSLREELISRIENLTIIVSEINKRISESVAPQAVVQETPVMMISYAPSSLTEVRDMINVNAVALIDASSMNVTEGSGEYDFESLRDYVSMVIRDSLGLLSIVKGNDNVYVMPINKGTLCALVSSRPLSMVEVNVARSLISNYLSSK